MNAKKEIQSIYPLAPMQSGMLFHAIKDENSHAYFDQTVITVHGQLNIHLFKESIQALVDRYDILRTNFVYQGVDKPMQVVLKKRRADTSDYDLSTLSGPEKQTHLDDYLMENRKRGFDLSKDILIRVRIFTWSPDEFRIVWAIHHILMDGWCLSTIYRELLVIYGALVNNTPVNLPEVTPYSRYIQWLEKQDKEKSLQFWKDYLNGFDRRTSLPDRGQVLPEYQNNRQDFQFMLPASVLELLSTRARESQVTLNTVVQSAWGLLLHRYNNIDDALFGAVVSVRPAEVEGIGQMVGLFLNTIPIRIRTGENKTFAELICSVHKENSRAKAFEFLPLAEIQNCSVLKTGLLDHIVAFENYPFDEEVKNAEKEGTSDFKISSVKTHEFTNYDLNIIIVARNNLVVKINFNPDVYSDTYIRFAAFHLKTVLTSVAENPGIPLNEINIIDETEKQYILQHFNQTEHPYPNDKTIHQLFQLQAERTPDRIVIHEDDMCLSYSYLDQAANRLAHRLRSHGLGHGNLAAIAIRRSTQMVISILAVLTAGAGYVPLNLDLPSKRLEFILKDCNYPLVLTLEGKPTFETSTNSIIELGTDNDDLNSESNTALEHVNNARDAAYIMFTSGSTGVPKGVIVEHRSVIRLVKNANFIQFNESDIMLPTGALDFDASTLETWGPLLNGSGLCLAPKDHILSPDLLKHIIIKQHVTQMWMTAPLFNQILDSNSSVFHGIRVLLVGGDALSTHHINRVRREHPGITVINGYGPTENTTFSTTFQVTGEYRTSIPIGTPINNSSAYILDASGRLAAVGTVGELWVGGHGLARGYLNNPEITAERFVFKHIPHSGQQEGEGNHSSTVLLYRTGDYARWLEDGVIQFLGRMDRQIKIRGFRIEPGEIENQILKHEQVQEVFVAVHSENDQKFLTAYIVFKRGGGETKEIRRYLSSHFAEYMIPSYFIELDRFPLTPNGKIDKNALPLPKSSQDQIESHFEAPGNEIEELLVTIWESVLGRKPIGVTDNFFMIGGDSIKSIQIASRMKKAGYKIEIKDIFQYPVISELARVVTKPQRIPEQGTVSGYVNLTPVQHWFFHSHFSHPHYFNQAVMLFSPKKFDSGRVERVFRKIFLHHDALRMTFHKENAAIIQLNHGQDYPFELEEIQLTEHDSAPAADRLKEISNRIQSSISLESGPLMKLCLLHMSDGDRLLIVCHHLVIDAVSWRILFEDIDALMKQDAGGESLELPLKTDSFKYWSERLSHYANSNTFLEQKDYWIEMEALAPPRINHETQSPYNRLQDSARLSFSLDEEQTDQLLTSVHHAFGTEINHILLTALALSFKDVFEISPLAIAMEGHGREEIIPDIDIQRTVGWFTTIFPLVLELKTDDDLASSIKLIKERLRRLPDKGIGYGILKYITAPENKQNMTFTIQPQISFNYLGQFDRFEKSTDDHVFSIAKESTGVSQSLNAERKYDFDVSGMVTDKRLSMSISYNSGYYSSETVKSLLDQFKSNLNHIIAFCSSRQAREFTPSDFTYKKLSMEYVDELSRQYDIADIYPMTPMQEGMLFHSLYNEGSATDFEQLIYTLKGELDLPALQDALTQLFKRHDILRTIFIYEGIERPLQLVVNRPDDSINIIYRDFYSSPPQEGMNEAVIVFRQEDRKRIFDLSRDVLMRLSVLRTDRETYDFIWSFHHILMDGWCTGILVKEFFELYAAGVEQRSPRLPLVRPYLNYIRWLDERSSDASRDYWKKYLDGYDERAGAPGKLPGGHAHTSQSMPESYLSQQISLNVSAENTHALNELAAHAQVTLNTVLQALWGILLAGYNGKTDVVFGAVVSGRPSQVDGIETMVGLFINTIPIRIRLKPAATFNDLLTNIQHDAIASENHHYYPLVEIQAQSPLNRNLIDHIFVFENYPLADKLEGLNNAASSHKDSTPGIKPKSRLTFSNVTINEQTNYDFNVLVVPGSKLLIKFKFNGHVYSKTSIQTLVHRLELLITQVIEDSIQPVGDLEFMDEDERKNVLYQFNSTQTPYPSNKTIHQIFEEQVAKTPHYSAVVFKNSHLSYQYLNSKSNQLARAIKSRLGDTHRESIVAILVEHSLDMALGLLAILKAGAGYLPLNPSFPKERIHYMLTESNTSLLITCGSQIIESSQPERVDVLDIETVDLQPFDGANLVHKQTARNVGYIMYTSGTTGNPKAVVIEHRNVVRLVRDTTFVVYEQGEALLQTGALEFDASTFEIWGALLNRMVLHFAPIADILEPPKLKNLLRRYHIHTIWLTAPLFNMMWDADPEIFCGLSNLLVGGDILSPTHINALIKAYPDLTVINGYGPTENTTFSTTYRIETPFKERIPIGFPISNSTAYIVDNALSPLPIGFIGELVVGGDGVSRGYLNNPELTAEKFIDDPFRSNGKIYRTGDLARWSGEGMIDFFGRADQQVKIRGFRIEPEEIQHAMLCEPHINESVIMPISLGADNDKQLIAYFVAEKKIDIPELKENLSTRLPAFMIPSYFVQLERIPLTPNGKIDRQVLPLPHTNEDSNYGTPIGEVEAALVHLWAEVLNIKASQINAASNFFDLGGHSLKATLLITKIHQQFHVKVPLTEVFTAPTIRELAQYIRNEAKTGFKNLENAEDKDYYPLSPAQRRLYISHELVSDNMSYNIPLVVVLEHHVDGKKLQDIFRQLIQRHESLRTSFIRTGGDLVQRVFPASHIDFQLEQYQLTGEIEQNKEHEEQMVKDFMRPFDLSHPPLIRGGLLQSAESRFIIMIDIHHIISDGVSMEIFKNEFMSLYRGEELPDLPIQYRDFSEWQNYLFSSGEMEKQRKFWLNVFREPQPLLQLPTDFPRQSIGDITGKMIGFNLDKERSIAVKELCKREEATAFIVLLAFYTIFMSRLSGVEDITCGTPTAGRRHSDLQHTIGMFVNTLALRNFPRSNLTFREYLKDVKQRTLEAFENEDYPFEDLVADVIKEKDNKVNPLFDVGFSSDNIEIHQSESQNASAGQLKRMHLDYGPKISRYTIIMRVLEAPDIIHFRLNYNTAIFKESTIQRFIDYFLEIVDAILANNNIILKDISIDHDLEEAEPEIPQMEFAF